MAYRFQDKLKIEGFIICLFIFLYAIILQYHSYFILSRFFLFLCNQLYSLSISFYVNVEIAFSRLISGNFFLYEIMHLNVYIISSILLSLINYYLTYKNIYNYYIFQMNNYLLLIFHIYILLQRSFNLSFHDTNIHDHISVSH